MANYAGKDENGSPLFNCIVTLVDDDGSKFPVTRNQRAAIERYYMGAVQADYTEYQAHWLISCAKYAKSVVDDKFARTVRPIKSLLSVVVAANITNTPDLAEAVVAWSEKMFERNVDEPKPERCTAYHDVIEICHQLYTDMAADGIEGVRFDP